MESVSLSPHRHPHPVCVMAVRLNARTVSIDVRSVPGRFVFFGCGLPVLFLPLAGLFETSVPGASRNASTFLLALACSPQRQSQEAVGRGLAFWTEIAASPRHNRPPDRCSAPVAAFSFASVDAMEPLILSRLAFRVKKIGNRGTAHHDGFL